MYLKESLSVVRWRWIVAGYAAAIGTGVLFALWIRSYGDWQHGLPWERSLMLAVHHHAVPSFIDRAFLVIPWLGTNLTLIPITVALAVWQWRRQRVDLALHLVVVQIGTFSMNPLVKGLFERARPELWEHRGQYAWAAYPSGHAIASVAMLFSYGYLLHREKGWTWPYFVIALLLAVSLYSRMYLGVHWPTDVIAGYAMGMVWLIFATGALAPRRASDRARRQSGNSKVSTPVHPTDAFSATNTSDPTRSLAHPEA
jgi:undecaprenyl-diphosphatase